MSVPTAIARMRLGSRTALARLCGASASSVAAVPPSPADIGRSELSQRRDRLARHLAELQWDLGGLTYEMAIRDHFRVDVLVRVSAQLQAVDVELAEIERLLHLDDAGASGTCPSCDAPHARGAAFCWRCGGTLLLSSGVPSDVQPTQVLPARSNGAADPGRTPSSPA